MVKIGLAWLGIEDGLSKVFKWFENRQDYGHIRQ